MQYFLVSDITYSYDGADYVGQQLYSAESADELFKFIYKRPADYEITEDDLWDKPVREKYKSDRGYAQAVGYWRARLGEKLQAAQADWARTVKDFYELIKELEIPCAETEMRLVQSFSLVDTRW